MAKFRSWNENQRRFDYFKDGLFFRDIDCKNYYNSNEVAVFDWSNAEQCITINKSLFYSENAKDDVLKDVEFFEGDIVKMHFFYDDADPVSLGWIEGEKEIIGILKCENVGGAVILSEDKEYSYQLLQEPIEELEKLGNIHENKEIKE